jgi:hypothetical protein
MGTSHTVGKHHVTETGDLVAITWHGPSSLAEIQEIMARVDRVYGEHGYALLLFDLTAAGPAQEGSRKWLAAWARDNPQCRVATFGGSLLVRTALHLLNRASRMFNSQIAETQFLASEAEARAWLATQRPKLKPAPR